MFQKHQTTRRREMMGERKTDGVSVRLYRNAIYFLQTFRGYFLSAVTVNGKSFSLLLRYLTIVQNLMLLSIAYTTHNSVT